MNYLRTILCAVLILTGMKTLAQTPSDAIMMQQRESCFAVIYDMGSFDRYWEGSSLRTNGTIATVSRNTLLPMIAIGIHDRINLIVAAPWVKTESSEPNGGRFAGAKGFQDIGLALKGLLIEREIGSGKLSILSTVGFSTPMTNYLSDYMPYSLGFGANEWSLRGILQYQMDNGLYFRSSVAYLWRGQTRIERDYYYNDGSYYTDIMDVPSAWNYQLAAGMWLFDNSLKFEGSYNLQNSTSGDDIRRYNAPQPTNKVDFGVLGFSAQYYLKKIKGLGALVYFNQTIAGRNTAKIHNLGVGLTYQFKI